MALLPGVKQPKHLISLNSSWTVLEDDATDDAKKGAGKSVWPLAGALRDALA